MAGSVPGELGRRRAANVSRSSRSRRPSRVGTCPLVRAGVMTDARAALVASQAGAPAHRRRTNPVWKMWTSGLSLAGGPSYDDQESLRGAGGLRRAVERAGV